MGCLASLKAALCRLREVTMLRQGYGRSATMQSAEKNHPNRVSPAHGVCQPSSILRQGYGRFATILLLILTFSVVALATPGTNENNKPKKPVKLSGLDAIGLPGESSTIRAKLERRGLLGANKDLKGFVLEFYRDDTLLAARTTDDEGFAHLDIPAPKQGRTKITVRFPGRGKYGSAKAIAYVYSFDPQKPGMLIDIDHTIADIRSLEFLVTDNVDIPALPQAPEVLTRLSARFNIIFLTAREDAFANKTRAWLELRKFSPAPVVYWDIGQSPLLGSQYKDKAIRSLQKRLRGLRIGVGDKISDARVYVKHGLRAFIITPRNIQNELPLGAAWIASWKEIEQLLEKEPVTSSVD